MPVADRKGLPLLTSEATVAWRRGWYAMHRGPLLYRCVHKECGREILTGQALYLDGRAGNVYCARHGVR